MIWYMDASTRENCSVAVSEISHITPNARGGGCYIYLKSGVQISCLDGVKVMTTRVNEYLREARDE